MRLSQVARKLNVGTTSLVVFLENKGYVIKNSPNSKITPEQLKVLEGEFAKSASDKREASSVEIGESYTEDPNIKSKKNKKQEDTRRYKTKIPKLKGLTSVGKIEIKENKNKKYNKNEEHDVQDKNISIKNHETSENKGDLQKNDASVKIKSKSKVKTTPSEIKVEIEELKGLTVMGKMDLPEKTVTSKEERKAKLKKEREGRRFLQVASSDKKIAYNYTPRRNKKPYKKETTKRTPIKLSEKDISEQIKSTLSKLSNEGKAISSSRAKYRKSKRSAFAEARETQEALNQEESKILEVSEFVSVSDLASMMDVAVKDVLAKCLEIGIMASINQRLDAETLSIITEEFGFNIKIKTAEIDIEEEEEPDNPKDLQERAPIVTIMGHVDHGKTSLLDYIRESDIISKEAGGITQHIGAYDIVTKNDKKITFLDTPGHEAFTAMRARGAHLTDVVIIVVAADDGVMPQTKEAINHAQLAQVPIVIAINKIDKPQANPEKIKEELSKVDILVEDWGGKYQCQHISAKTGEGVDILLEKILLESELLELKANPNKRASGSVIEASLDKGRGYTTTIMVQDGTLHAGDIIVAGPYYGKVKAMFNYHEKRLKDVPPSTPVQMLGLNGAPQSGDRFKVMALEKDAKSIALKRQQILREQQIKTRKHITLDEVSKRLALGNFQELKIIIKGDVDGSVEALSDALLKLSTENIKINIIHKAVGGISDSDVLLASASDAIIIGFQVRPSGSARKLAEKEGIDIRLYSVIYDAIDHVKDAIQGMVVKEKKEIVYGAADVREIFKISKVGTVAGCYISSGTINRNYSVRLIRDGIVVYTGKIQHLKRMKNDVQEVKTGFECGISIENFNDIKQGDIIEAFGFESE